MASIVLRVICAHELLFCELGKLEQILECAMNMTYAMQRGEHVYFILFYVYFILVAIKVNYPPVVSWRRKFWVPNNEFRNNMDNFKLC